MVENESKPFVEKTFARVIKAISSYTADIQAKLIPRRISAKYDASECCATSGILVGCVILLLSWFIPVLNRFICIFSYFIAQGIWCMILIRASLAIFALWWAVGAFSYPVKVVLVDLPSGGALKSATRSLILLFFNYIEIIIHFASAYLLTLSIGYSDYENPVRCPLEGLYFSVVTITTLGYGDIRPISWIGRVLVSLQVLFGIVMIVAVLGIFLQLVVKKNVDTDFDKGRGGEK